MYDVVDLMTKVALSNWQEGCRRRRLHGFRATLRDRQKSKQTYLTDLISINRARTHPS